MNRKEYKVLFENWNKLLNERPYNPYQYSLSKDNNSEYEEDTIINSVWTFIQIADPTPITGIPDLYHSIKDFKNNKSLENALECVWNGVTLIPGLNLLKKLKKIKDLNKLRKLPTKAHVLMKNQIKQQASNTFEKIKDGQDFLEGLYEQINLNEEEKKRIKLQIDRLKEIENKIKKDLPIIDNSDYQRSGRKDNKGGHIH